MKSGAPPTALYAGDQLDRYELLCPLAQGGMAAVWLARLHGKHGFQKLFAVKFILPEFAEDVRFQQMFLDEARIASGISHPFVANILDLGEERGILYIVMDWVDGDSLSKLVSQVGRRRERIPANIAVRIAADVSGALHAAHELHDADGHSLGVVHRDVSLSNVLLTTKGSPKVIDFGIAKAVVRLTQETGAGLMKGKIMYMAPEQAMAKAVDRRADVWAVAAVLHTMLAGDPPYTGDHEMAILHRLTSGGIPNALPLTVPANVRAILKAAMCFDRNQRTATCAELQAALEAALTENGTPTTAADVAAYSARYLSDAAAHRHDLVRAALDEAAKRQSLRPGSHNSLTPPGACPQGDRSSKTPSQGAHPFPLRPSTGRNSRPMADLSSPSISGPSLTTPPTSGPSAPAPSRRGAAIFAAGAVVAGALALTSWVLLRSRGHAGPGEAAMLTQGPVQSSRDPQVSLGGNSAMAPPLAIEAPGAAAAAPATGNAPTVSRMAPGAAAAPVVAAPAATAARGRPGGNNVAVTPVAPDPPPPSVNAPVNAPVAPPVVVAPAPAAPQAAFAPESGKVTVGKVDVDRVTARSVNGLLRHVNLDRCYVAALRSRGAATSGSGALVLEIDQNQVSRAHLQGDLGLPGLGDCITSQFTSLRVDDADTGSATARITLSFATP